MDKSAESSDSDSSSSTSWVFVDDAATFHQSATNTFHLDCSREPIQELTEQDLLSGGSDFESDTDGVSVISESEVPTDDSYANIQTISTSSNDTSELKEETNVNDNNEPSPVNNDGNQEHSEPAVVSEEHARPNNIEITKLMKPLHLLGVGFVLIAVCVASYNQIMTKMCEKDFEEDKLTLYDKVELGSDNNGLGKLCDNNNKWEKELIKEKLNNNNRLYKAKRDSNKKLLNKRLLIKDDVDDNVEKIIDITVSCAFRDRPTSNLVNKVIKECATKEYKRRKEEGLKREDDSQWIPEKRKVKYHYKYTELLNDDEKFTENEYQMQATEKMLRAEQHEFAQTREKKDCIVNSIEDKYRNYEEKTKKHKKRNEKIKYDRDESIADFKMNEDVNKIQKKNEKYNKLRKYDKYQCEEASYKKEDKKNIEKNSKRGDDNYAENYKNKKSMKKMYKYDSHEKYHKGYKYKKCDFVAKDSKLENYEKKNKNDKDKLYKSEEDFINNSDRIRHSKYKSKLNHNYIRRHKHNNTDGAWYINMHKARNEMRKQEHVSDWVFDRAYLRSKKRNKAQWYFKWMNVREQLRYKRSYKPYSS